MDTIPTVINVINFGDFVMPTAFTPNGDDKNQYFYPKVNGPNSPVRITAFRIYSRWGQLVYDDPNAPGWNGSFGGNPQVAETYLYFVTVEYPDPNNPARKLQKSVEGSFLLRR
jgi:gliding motility-associated-like protein